MKIHIRYAPAVIFFAMVDCCVVGYAAGSGAFMRGNVLGYVVGSILAQAVIFFVAFID